MDFVTPPDIQQKKKTWFSKHHILGYVFLLAVLAAAVSGIYYLQVSNQPIDTTPVIHKDPTAGWKTYTNDKYGFEIKYPKEGTALENTKDGAIVNVGITINRPQWEDLRLGVDLYLISKFSNQTITAWYEKFYQEEKTKAEESDLPLFFSPIGETVELNGYPAYKTNDFAIDHQDINYYLTNSGFVFKVHYNDETANDKQWQEDKKLVNQILSTFKFIEPVKPTTKGVSISKLTSTVPTQNLVPSESAIVTMDDFAKCLANKNTTMYGAVWCPHCQNEKKAFGSSWQFVSYVECPDKPDACMAAGVTGYPTWVLVDGQKLIGEQNGDGFAKLAAATSCELPSN